MSSDLRSTETGSGSDDVGSDEVSDFLSEHPALVKFGRVGWVSKGIVYTLVGLLAFSIAFGEQGGTESGTEASQTGAVARIAEASYGTALLILVAAGLVLYALWRIVTIVLPAKNDAHTWMTRAGYAVSTVVYLALAWTAVSYVRRSGSAESGQSGSSEESRVDGVTNEIMSHIGGRWLVALGGLVVVGIGVYFFIRATRRPFEDDLDGGGVGPVEHRHLVLMGRVGWTGRSVMMVLIGFFLIQAAWQADAEEATGLDGALRRSVETTFGTVLVAIVAVGLIVYGVYCVVSAPRRRLAPADS